MTAFPEPVRSGRLAARNPVLKLAAATAPTVALVATTDVVTPAVVLAVLLVALPFSGVALVRLLRRAWLLLVGAATVGLVNALVGSTTSGRALFDAGPLHLTTGSAQVGLGITLRVLAIALPGVLVLAATDPVDLADSLVQQARTPARFAYGTLAALRLLPLLAEEWDTLTMARRARGIDAGRSPVAAVRLFASQVFALLVGAIRRGTRLATAMDARGFDSGLRRTFARRQVVVAEDVALVAAAVLVTAAAVAVSMEVGAWKPLVAVVT
jgi:energy-coupling factor transport system permease protein